MNAYQVDAMLFGLMAASFVTFWLSTVDDPWKAASAVLFSALLAGPGAPVAAAYLVAKFPMLEVAATPLRLLMAVMIGGSVTWLLPVIIKAVRKKIGGQNGGQ